MARFDGQTVTFFTQLLLHKCIESNPPPLPFTYFRLAKIFNPYAPCLQRPLEPDQKTPIIEALSSETSEQTYDSVRYNNPYDSNFSNAHDKSLKTYKN
jgi:hypothetical protein